MSKVVIQPKNNSSSYTYVNVRERPDIESKAVNKIEGHGKLAIFIEEVENNGFVFSHYKFENGSEGWSRNDVHERVELEDVFINVPYVSQNDSMSSNFINDCGIACICMLAKYKNKECDVNSVAKTVGMTKYGLTSFQHMIKAANKLGIKVEFERPFDLVDGIKHIKKGLPYIALINYNYIDTKEKFPHFVVVVGIDDDMIEVLDPYNINVRKIPVIRFGEAISKLETTSNMPFQSLLLME